MERRGFIARLTALLGIAVAAKVAPAAPKAVQPRIEQVGYWNTLGDLYGRRQDGSLERMTVTHTNGDVLFIDAKDGQCRWVNRRDLIFDDPMEVSL